MRSVGRLLKIYLLSSIIVLSSTIRIKLKIKIALIISYNIKLLIRAFYCANN